MVAGTGIISIHAPCEGGDFLALCGGYFGPISIHAPCEGGDSRCRTPDTRYRSFQSTPPVKGATAKTAKIFDRFYKKTSKYHKRNPKATFDCEYIACFSKQLLQNSVRGYRVFLFARISHLKHQDILGIIRNLCAEMLDLIFMVIPQIIKPQAVFFRIHDLT